VANGSFVSVGRSLSDAIARVRLAEELGYDAAYVTHIAARERSIEEREAAGVGARAVVLRRARHCCTKRAFFVTVFGGARGGGRS
jgi:hypothetical protein